MPRIDAASACRVVQRIALGGAVASMLFGSSPVAKLPFEALIPGFRSRSLHGLFPLSAFWSGVPPRVRSEGGGPGRFAGMFLRDPVGDIPGGSAVSGPRRGVRMGCGPETKRSQGDFRVRVLAGIRPSRATLGQAMECCRSLAPDRRESSLGTEAENQDSPRRDPDPDLGRADPGRVPDVLLPVLPFHDATLFVPP